MRTIRRLYFYAVAFITFEVVLWGLIRLLRSIFSPSLGSGSGGDTLAQALALILVGVPIFALHWLWAQRASAADEEEGSSSLRAIFLYGTLLATLIPITQNLLALVDRSLLMLAGMDSFRAIIGGAQTWLDNVIAILMNTLVAAYFISVLRRDWASLKDTENLADIRRLYRYIWMLYSLLMVIFGAQQLLRFILYVPSNLLGQLSRDLFINGLSLLLVGAPIWYFSWKTCQDAVTQQGERDSLLRMGVLYLLMLAGVATVLSVSGSLVNLILRRALGEALTTPEFFSRIGSPISIALPMGIVWAYFGRWLRHDINSFSDVSRRPELHRLYTYILSFAGLVTAFTGTALLVTFIIDTLVGHQIWGQDLRLRIAAALASLIVGLPLWLATWPRAQAQAGLQDAEGEFARRSVIRKTYLYLALFASVIGGMVFAVTVVYRLLQAVLGSQPLDLPALLTALGLLLLFIIVLVYHLRCLRADGTEAVRAVVDRRGKYTVVAFEQAGSGLGDALQAAAQKQVPGLNLTVLSAESEIPVDAAAVQAVILPSDLTIHQPPKLGKFLSGFTGRVIILPVENPHILWTGAGRKPADAAVLLLRQLSEGQEIRTTTGGTSGWMVLVYILAGIAGLELLMMLLSFGIRLIIR
jgi:hypothetical protein